MVALLLSPRAPANISDAEAEPPLVIMIISAPFVISPFFAKNLCFLDWSLVFVDTISPLSKNKSVTLIAWSRRPPGLLRISMIKPLILLSDLLLISLTAETIFLSAMSLKLEILIYPISVSYTHLRAHET